ncbi:MAG: metal ABC transporter permease [Oscillospiraceae bacterium]|jgi:zinc transport system permease protein|nr:metal ABC transporter permease [Oscillospiraceae bacterium]
MTIIQNVIYSWTHYTFIRYALIGVLLFAPMVGALGTLVVNGQLAFFSDSLGHSALTGIALGLMLGLRTPLWAMLAFGVVFAAGLCVVKSRGAASTDTTIGVFSSTAMALGVVLLSLKGEFAKYSNYLVGDLLSIAPWDLPPLGAALVLVVIYCVLRYNKLLMLNANPALAKSRGIAVRVVETGFACVLALVVMLSIRWVGILMINAMLVIPAACARNLARDTRGYVLGAVALALACGTAGLALSLVIGTAAGATIVLLLAACYAASLVVGRRGNGGVSG